MPLSSSQWMIAEKVPLSRGSAHPPQSGMSILTSAPMDSVTSSAMSSCAVFQSLQPEGTDSVKETGAPSGSISASSFQVYPAVSSRSRAFSASTSYSSPWNSGWISPEGKAGFNFGRFDDPVATEALNTYANASSDEERTAALDTLQQIFVEQVPAIPLGAHPLLGEFNTRNYVGWPSEEDPYASADPTQQNIVQILTKLTPAE